MDDRLLRLELHASTVDLLGSLLSAVEAMSEGVEDVAPILSKAVELLRLADRERWRETSEMGQIKAAARARYEEFKRSNPRTR